MKKLLSSFFIVLILLVIMNIGCSKKSAGKPSAIDTTTKITTPIPTSLDTITAAGRNAGIGSVNAANQLNNPAGIFVDSAGDIYIADYFNCRVQEWIPGADSGITVAGGNGAGSAANQLYYPVGLCLDNAGNIYVVDYGNGGRVQKWAPGATIGITVAGGNGSGSAANQFSNPKSVWLDAGAYIYVSDGGNYRVQKFPPGSTSSTNGVTAAGGNGYGTAANQLSDEVPGLFIDKIGNLYVVDNSNQPRIQKFPPGSSSATNGITVAGNINLNDTAANVLFDPVDVAVDDSGYMYVSDDGYNRVQKFPPNSTSGTNGVTVAGSSKAIGGSAYNLLQNPTYIFLDAGAKNLYISDSYNDRIQKYELK